MVSAGSAAVVGVGSWATRAGGTQVLVNFADVVFTSSEAISKGLEFITVNFIAVNEEPGGRRCWKRQSAL